MSKQLYKCCECALISLLYWRTIFTKLLSWEYSDKTMKTDSIVCESSIQKQINRTLLFMLGLVKCKLCAIFNQAWFFLINSCFLICLLNIWQSFRLSHNLISKSMIGVMNAGIVHHQSCKFQHFKGVFHNFVKLVLYESHIMSDCISNVRCWWCWQHW